jgi:hypothetical protein
MNAILGYLIRAAVTVIAGIILIFDSTFFDDEETD